MIRKADPLAQNAKTWSGLSAGPPCRICSVNLTEGHRYYEEKDLVVHYSCLSQEEKKIQDLF